MGAPVFYFGRGDRIPGPRACMRVGVRPDKAGALSFSASPSRPDIFFRCMRNGFFMSGYRIPGLRTGIRDDIRPDEAARLHAPRASKGSGLRRKEAGDRDAEVRQQVLGHQFVRLSQ